MENKPTNNQRGNRPRRPMRQNGSPQPGSGQRRGGQGGGGNSPRPGQTPQQLNVSGATMSRGAAVRAQKRSQADAQKIANQYAAANPQQVANVSRRANFVDD